MYKYSRSYLFRINFLSEIKRELGWQPKETFETGLKTIIQWYLENPEWVKSVITGEYRKWIQNHYDGR
jgi:dTDP-glucose 4,6-dehydratase